VGVEYPEMAGEGGIILQGMRWDGRMGRRSLSIVADRLVAGVLGIFPYFIIVKFFILEKNRNCRIE